MGVMTIAFPVMCSLIKKKLSKDVCFCKYNETWCSPWIGFNIFYPVSHIYMYMNNLYISATLLVRVSLLFLIKKAYATT